MTLDLAILTGAVNLVGINFTLKRLYPPLFTLPAPIDRALRELERREARPRG